MNHNGAEQMGEHGDPSEKVETEILWLIDL
jgi:hypothetical protein